MFGVSGNRAEEIGGSLVWEFGVWVIANLGDLRGAEACVWSTRKLLCSITRLNNSCCVLSS